MLPRHQQPQIQKPLQNEIVTLNKLLGVDILEQAARILDHFVTTSKFETVIEPPAQLQDKLMEKCEDFETVCDQIYYTLEQSKRVLQLEYQQKVIELKAENAEKEKQQLEKPEQDNDPMHVDVEFESSQMSMDMMDTDTKNEQQEQKDTTIDAEDMEELLQIQRDRLERLKNVIVMGMDAEAVKSKGGGDREDLLF